MARVRGFAVWRPQRATLELVEQVQAVLHEYADYLPLTIRQVFYRLVGNSGYDKTEQAYSRLCETLNRARRAGHIPFEHIRDDGVTALRPQQWDGTAHFKDNVGYMARGFKLDRQAGQAVRLWVLCEAGGMAPMLSRAALPYGVPVLSSGGFDSLTAKYDLAQEIAAIDCPCEVLHIGDHDPSGVHLFSSLAEDLQTMAHGLGGYIPTFVRLAVTPDQMAEMNLPTAPAKKTDRRAFDGETTQAEAIPPDELTAILRNAIVTRQDPIARADVLDAEAAAQAELLAWVEDAA